MGRHHSPPPIATCGALPPTTAADAATACISCAPGRYTDAPNELLACKPCEPGTFNNGTALAA